MLAHLPQGLVLLLQGDLVAETGTLLSISGVGDLDVEWVLGHSQNIYSIINPEIYNMM